MQTKNLLWEGYGYFLEPHNCNNVVYICGQDRFVCVRKMMDEFFFGSLRTKSEPIGEEKSEQEKTNNSQHGPNNFFIIITILPIFSTVRWQM